MKTKYLIFIVLLAITFKCFSQKEWAPIGATWHYDYYAQLASGYIKIESIKDTLVEAKQCKYLYVTETVYEYPGVIKTYSIDSLITRQENSKVYIYSNNKFVQLYDFNPSVGDIWDTQEIGNIFNTWNTHLPIDTIPCPAGKVIVDSVKTILINNQPLKAIYTSPYKLSKNYFDGLIIEGIGCLGYMFPNDLCNQIIDSSYPSFLRCYSSPSFSHTWSNKSCEYTTDIKNLNSEEDVLVYPNPTDNLLSIKIRKQEVIYPVNLIITSLSGVEQLNELINSDTFTLPINHLPAGIYILTIKDKYSIINHSKINVK